MSRLWAAGFMAAVLWPSAAAGQSACRDRGVVLEHLAKKYSEVPIASGVTNTGSLVEVLTTGDGKTWTIIISAPNGMACMLASGEGWRSKEPAEPEGLPL